MRRCAYCGHPLVPTVYGLPGIGLAEAAERGEVIIGGCIPSADDQGCPGCSQDGSEVPTGSSG